MKIVKTLLLTLVLCFSFGLFSKALPETDTGVKNKSSPPVSVYNLLLKLEEDLKSGKPKSAILSDLKQIEKAKASLPVSYIPDLNYLMGSQVEKIPSTELTFLKNLAYYIYPLEVALKVFLFLLLFYTFIFYFQNTEIQPLMKRVLTVAGVSFLVFSFVVNIGSLIYVVIGFGFILLAVLKKKRLSLYLLLAASLLFISQVVYDNAFQRVKSDNLLYYIKVSRDGYAPDYLIEKVFIDGKSSTVESVTSQLALGRVDAVKRLENLKFSDPLRQSIVLNDYGYVYFLLGDFKRALSLFESAFRLYPSPELKYNLYLTYSSLLKLEEANRLKDELIKKGISVEKLPPVPVLIHLSAPLPGYVFPFGYLIGFLLGILAGVVFARFYLATFGNFEPELLLVPGMRAFINSRVRHIFLVSLIVFLVNIILGRLICSV